MKIQSMHRGLLAAAIFASLFAGCASAPERSAALDKARADVDSLSNDPLAGTAASRQLADARLALDQAQAAQAKHEKAERVDSLAYIASRNAETGLAATGEARAQRRVAEAEADRSKVILESRERETDQAKAQAQAAMATAQQQTQAADVARQETDAARQETDAARQEAEAARQESLRMQQAYADMEAKQTARGMVLTLGSVLFDTGQATLKPGAELILDRLGKFMTETPEIKVLIEGHTDSAGADDYNQLLSQHRADAVAVALASRGIAGDRVQAQGRGETYPVATNGTPTGRQQNRRVEVVFSDLEGRFNQPAGAQAAGASGH